MYALVEIKGKQYKAEKGALLKIDRVRGEKGENLEFESVLLLSDDNGVKLGAPFVSGAKVKAVVENHGRDDKVIVFKFKKRKDYRKKRGHRQQYSIVRVEDITGL